MLHGSLALLGCLFLNELGRHFLYYYYEKPQLKFIIERRQLAAYLSKNWKREVGFGDVRAYIRGSLGEKNFRDEAWDAYKKEYARNHLENESQQLLLAFHSALVN